MSEGEDDDVTVPSDSDGEDQLKDAELMKDILQSIESLRKLPTPSESTARRYKECETVDVNQAPVNLDNLTLLELNVILDQVSQALECNNSLQSILLMKEVKLLSIKRQIQVFKTENQRQNGVKEGEIKGDIGKYIVSFKAPYFKDHRNFAGYTIVPERDLPFSAAKYAHKAMQWNKFDMKELENAVKTYLLSRKFNSMMTIKPKTKAQKESILKKYAMLRKASLNELISDDFDNIIDWCHIASRLKKNHSPYECQKAWDTFLRPSINKKKWSKEELEKLKISALERNYEDWDAIAEDLGTNRSGYQCFYEYVEVLMKLQEGEWSKTEEEFLIKLVKECTYGDKVLWHKISYYFESRSLAQIYRKWNLSSVGKNHKVGHFEEEEDQIIIDSLIMSCGDVNRVARRLNRLPSQIRYRLAQLRSSLQHRYGEWTVEEDEQLLSLVEKYGKKKWAVIAEHIPSRGRVQIRHRYEHLRKKMAMNPGKNLDELLLKRPKRPSFKNRKQVNIKYLLDKKNQPGGTQKTNKAGAVNDDPDDPDEKEDTVIGFDTSFGPLVLRKDDVEGVMIKKKGGRRGRRKQVLTPKVVHEVVFNDDVVETVDLNDDVVENFVLDDDVQEPVDVQRVEPEACKSNDQSCTEENLSEKGKKQSKTSTKKLDDPKVKAPTKKSKVKPKVETSKPPPDLSVKILEYYASTSDYIGGPVKPSDVCDGELESELTNALLKFKPYKYFNNENADWWYGADRSDPYYKEVFSQVERKEKEEYEVKEGANWLLPPCATSFEGFYNILVDIDYKPEDLAVPEGQLEEELKELYCTSDEETTAAVARWKERLKTLFLWPAALSEIELDKNDEEGDNENPTCTSQVLNESEIIQLAEELNQIEDDELRAVMVKQLGLVDGSNPNNENVERLSVLVLQDETTLPIKSELQESPETSEVEMDTGEATGSYVSTENH
uniref:snRNA-activating protein complex subunit 4 n=2 Tax=Lygus hesperus TaxID=30085 RepID=A0A0A9Y2H3_LYGHE